MKIIVSKDGRFTAKQVNDAWSVKHNASNAQIGQLKNKQFYSGLWSYTKQDILVLYDLILEIEKTELAAL